MVKVLGMGNALVDIIIKLESDKELESLAIPKGSMQLVDQARAESILSFFEKSPKVLASGGSASNTIHGLAALGVETGFIGCVGKDSYGEFYTQDLKKQGVHPYLKSLDMASGRAITLMSPDSERSFATFLGAACTLSQEHLDPSIFVGYDYFYIEGYLVQNYELIESALKMAKDAGLIIACDLASYNVVEDNLDFLKKIIPQYIDIVFMNEQEAQAFTGKADMEALHILADLCDIAVLKLGARGSMIKQKGKVQIIAPCEAKCIDTNGAGDSYAAGFFYGLTKGLSLQKSGEIASLISSHLVGVVGPKLSPSHWASLKPAILEIENK